jgi:signal transduction histidine kinase/ActR/RegA family two-component response regulator
MPGTTELLPTRATERDRIGVEQVSALHSNARVGVTAALVGLAVVADTLVRLGSITWQTGAPWLATAVVISGAQLWQGWWWMRSPDRNLRWHRYARWFAFWAFCEGLFWAFGSVFCVSRDTPERQLLMVAVILGLASGSAVAFGSYLPACLAFMAAASLPFLVTALTEGGTLLNGAALMLAMWGVGVALLARRNNTVFIDNLRLQFANLDLAERLKEERDRAEQASLAKSRFLAAASHDLRQPVHALSMLTEAFCRDGMTAANLRVLELMRQSVEAMDALFDALLDVSRLDAGVIVPQVQAFAIGPLLARLAAELGPRAEAKGLRLVVHPCTRVVRGDPVLTERIIRNLLDNAVRYTERGRVVVGCRRRGLSLSVEVWDTGPGIPAEEQARVFEEFHQLGNPERDRTKGLGLGLAIVRRLAGLMAMPLELRSAPGRGSVFRLVVPLAPVETAAEEAAADPTEPAAVPAHGLILIIDDEAAIREAVRLLLKSWGYAVLAAGSGDEMLATVVSAGARPDLILCDFRLRGGENGIDAIARMRAACGYHAPAVLVTGDTAPDRLTEAQAAGLPLLHKPVAPGRLRAVVRALIADRAQMSDA